MERVLLNLNSFFQVPLKDNMELDNMLTYSDKEKIISIRASSIPNLSDGSLSKGEIYFNSKHEMFYDKINIAGSIVSSFFFIPFIMCIYFFLKIKSVDCYEFFFCVYPKLSYNCIFEFVYQPCLKHILC
jgi:hypothetical protein